MTSLVGPNSANAESPGRRARADSIRIGGARRRPSLPFDGAPTLDMPKRHALELQDVNPRHLQSVLLATYDRAPENFEVLL